MAQTALRPAPARLAGLDLTRAAALWCILTFHFDLNIQTACPGAPAVGFVHYANGTLGHIGVSLFFVLSGAALMVRYRDGCPWRAYLARRAAALYPMFWVGWGALFLYSDLLHRNLDRSIPLWRLVWSALGMDGYLNALAPNFYKIGEWFLGCLILLYLAFPLLRRGMLARPGLTLAGLAALHILWTLFYPGRLEIEHHAVSRLLEFALGMGLALWRPRLPRWAPWLGAGLAAVVLFVPLPGPRMLNLPALGAGLCLALWALGDRIAAPAARRTLQRLAALSYPLYLVHHVTLTILFVPRLAGRALTMPAVAGLYLLYLLTAALAALALRAVTGWLERLAGRAEEKAAALAKAARDKRKRDPR